MLVCLSFLIQCHILRGFTLTGHLSDQCSLVCPFLKFLSKEPIQKESLRALEETPNDNFFRHQSSLLGTVFIHHLSETVHILLHVNNTHFKTETNPHFHVQIRYS